MASDPQPASEPDSANHWVAIIALLFSFIALLLAFLSCGYIQSTFIVQHNVTVDNNVTVGNSNVTVRSVNDSRSDSGHNVTQAVGSTNETLQFGSLGYCLNSTCVISVFKPINDTNIVAQIRGGSTFPILFPLTTGLATIAALSTLAFSYSNTDIAKWSARAGAGSAAIGIIISIIFYTQNTSGGFLFTMGAGTWLILMSGIVLSLFALYPKLFPVEMKRKKEEEKKKKLEEEKAKAEKAEAEAAEAEAAEAQAKLQARLQADWEMQVQLQAAAAAQAAQAVKKK